MDFTSKLKETLTSVVPLVVFVLILNFSIAPVGNALVPFLVGAILVVVGLTLFLGGTDIGMTAVGEKLGSVLAHSKNVVLILVVGFIIGFGVTFAEPDVNVLASQVHSLNPAINERLLVFFIATGLGLFVDMGMLRILKNIRLKWVLVAFYLVVFAVVSLCGQAMASIAFDASGATTGPLAVPFLLALGLGVSSASNTDRESSFGLTGIASIGPILAVGIMASVTSRVSGAVAVGSAEAEKTFLSILVAMIKKTAVGFGPLAIMIIIMQIALLHFPKIKFKNICLGIIYAFIGIVIFLTGVDYGFTSLGSVLGRYLAAHYSPVLVTAVSLIFGAIVVSAEPAVWVLTEQVEKVTVGRIKRSLVLIFLCIGVACAVGLAIVRAYVGINYLWFIYTGVGCALILSFFCPTLFVGIAFDSGGVASGPLSTTFLLSFAMGVSGSGDMGFGLVGLIAIAPLIAVQILGILFDIKEKRITKSVDKSGENN